MDHSQLTPEELQRLLGDRLRALRLSRNLTQAKLASRAGISPLSLSHLESGRGSTVETLLRALKGLEMTEAIDTLAPEPTVSPLALVDRGEGRKRASSPRRRKPSNPA